MSDRHVYYPDPGWQVKWIIAALIMVTAISLFLWEVLT